MTIASPSLPSTRLKALRQFNPLLVAALLCALQVLATWPGELTDDSREQLHQALTGSYADWHPPIMALVWSWLLKLGRGPGSLLLLHQALHWLGFGLIADGCRRSERHREAWLVLLAGAFPIFLFYDRIVIKDVGMANALVAGAGIALWFILQRRRVPFWALLLSALCIAYGTLIRTNAIFAIAPLLLLYRVQGRTFSYVQILMCAVLTALLALPLSNWINHRLIGARPQYPLQSLQIFDLMGIAVRAHDAAVFGPAGPTLEAVQSCYTPYWWDPVSPWGSCPQLRQTLGFTSNIDTSPPQAVAATAQLWRTAILHHPWAYLLHRLEYFNASEYFLVPAYAFRYSKAADIAPYGSRVISRQTIILDYVRVNVLCWPVFWASLGACLLALLGGTKDIAPEAALARLLTSSGLLYSGGYFLVGVATDIRYHYWCAMCVLISLILVAPVLGPQLRAAPGAARRALAVMGIIVVLGYAARIADIPLL